MTMTAAAAGNDANKENKIMKIDGGEDGAGAGGKDNSGFDDELILVRSGKTCTQPYHKTCLQSPCTKASRKHTRMISKDEDDDSSKSYKCEKSDSSSCSGIACRNVEAGTQITRSIDTLSDILTKPVVTTEDMSHGDKVIEILKDKTLLPPDPCGHYFCLVSQELMGNPALSCVLIVEADHTCCKALLKGILGDTSIVIPTNNDAAATAAIGPV
jgi:hypothetical protein